MPKPRYAQVSLDATPYYHCIARCVRKAYLCGTDVITGESYEHRRQWLEDKLLELGDIFAIDICAYAIMSNHYHLVLHINKAEVIKLTQDEVLARWLKLFKGAFITQQYCKGERMSEAQLELLAETVETWRERLMDISWFMRVLNESIARQANAEDHCTGRFWEGRFKTQALLDEAALMSCMAYVDLNPIRAALAKTPEASNHTSLKRRLTLLTSKSKDTLQKQPAELFPLIGDPRKNMPEGLPFKLMDYIDLVEWTGRQLRPDKRGSIDEDAPPILQRLNVDAENWLFLTRHFESRLKGLVGSIFAVKKACKVLGYKRTIENKVVMRILRNNISTHK